MRLLNRIRRTLRPKEFQRDLDDEFRFHMDMREQKNREEGMSGREARRSARLQFGNPTAWSERTSEVDRLLLPLSVLEDLRYGVRQLWRSPAFTITAVLTLALGIGANTTIFSVADAVLLRPLPYPDASRMVVIHERMPKGGTLNDSWSDFQDWKAQNHAFDRMAVIQNAPLALDVAGAQHSLPGAFVSNSFFGMFGINPVVGRAFTRAEANPNSAPAAVVSYSFWQRYLSADNKAFGKPIRLDGQAVTVVGVLPRSFWVPWGEYQVYLPIGQKADTAQFRNRADHPGLQVIATLRRGVTIQAARSEMGGIMRRLGRAYPQSNRGEMAVLKPLLEQFVGQAREILMLLLGATGLILLLACVNIANMVLARSATRQREFAVRVALGAGRARLFRQALTENLPVAVLGGAAGVGLAALAIRPLVGLYPHQLFRLQSAHISSAALGFTVCICIASWLLFGMIPAVAASRRTRTTGLLHSATPASRVSTRGRLRAVLLVAEIAIALVVTVCAGLLTRSLSAVVHVDPGFRSAHVLAIENVDARHQGMSARNLEFYRELLTRLRHLPGVKDAAAAMQLPLTGAYWTSPYSPDGHKHLVNTQEPWTEINVVLPGYFHTMGIRLLSGRLFSNVDSAGSAPVAVVNESMERSLRSSEGSDGQLYVQYAPHAAMRVVGVVADVKQFSLDRADMPEVYVPAAQAPIPAMNIVLRTDGNPGTLAHAAIAVVHDFDGNQPSLQAVRMDALLDNGLGNRRFETLLLGLFDALALVLAVVGVAGVVSYLVEQRTHEIGVRMALGASRSDVLRMIVLDHTVRLAALGIAIGIVAAFGLARLLDNQLYGVGPTDPITFISASFLLLAAVVLASLFPTRRAISIDPIVALRCE